MKLLLSDKEIADYLISLLDFKKIIFPNSNYHYNQPSTEEAIKFVKKETENPRFKLEKKKQKIKNKIVRAVTRDLRDFINQSKSLIASKKKNIKKGILTNLDTILESLGEETVLKKYKKSQHNNFVKTVGLQIDQRSKLSRVKKYQIDNEPFLIRNTNANENLLVRRVKTNLPFWFIDSGYTNFLETHKKWHRIVENHLHYGKLFDAPVDRLSSFKTFPKPWRTGGHTIMIIEPGPFSAAIFGVDISQWKRSVEIEIRKYTDKPIVFREKINKKVRKNLYRELCDEDYYCTINLNSNAATESLWAGIPAITLDRHITNPVTSNKISDINNLPRPNLANWLCMLSYSQFTYDELMDGTAYQMVKKYHA
jgi:hypothetical protein